MKQQEVVAAVEDARRKHNVPGVTAAFYADGQTACSASGTANVSTGVDMTVDTLAHVGSITKVMTATLLMQLVDRGIVILDRPVAEYLPEFRFSDGVISDQITVEMLVNHTSGLGANLLPDQGHDNEIISRTFERVISEPQLHSPGAARSYCNAGTVVAGYLCQRLTNTSWYDLIFRDIFKPLNLTHSAVLPENALLHRASVGHFADPASGTISPTTHAFLPLGYAPAGSTNMMSASDLLTFALAHLNGGRANGGERILSEESAARMPLQSGNPAVSAFDSGIGWRRFKEFIGHGGGGPGIVSYVSIHPASRTIAVVLTNAEHGLAVLRELISPFMMTHAGADPLPALPEPADIGLIDVTRYVGTYENNTVVHEISARGADLYWTASVKHQYYDSSHLQAPPAVRLVPVAADWFVGDARESALNHAPVALLGFVGNSENRAAFLVQELWLFPRAAT